MNKHKKFQNPMNDKHQIGRVTVHCLKAKQINSLNEATYLANETTNTLSVFCQEKLPILLNTAFKKINNCHQKIISIDTLELNLGQVCLSQLETTLVQKLDDRLHHAQYLTQAMSIQEWFFSIVSDYLNTGISPWNSSKLSNQEWIDGLRSLCVDKNFNDFLYQLEKNQGEIITKRLYSLLNGLGLEAEWNNLNKKNSDFSVVCTVTQNEQINIFMNNSILVKNAGLVLLTPFLPFFFKHINLVDEEYHFYGDKQRGQAVYVLQYLLLIEGQEEEITIEGDMTLNKLLCGWSMYEPLPIKAKELPYGYKDEFKDLLKSLFEQWDAIKDYSQEELAEIFFRRSGLIKMKTVHNLYVEWQPKDNALKTLPWTLSIIKTPWMIKPLMVEWNS